MAKTPPLSVNIKEQKYCNNCTIFSWEQPDDRSTIKKCSRCELFWYCSKQCQEEHWHNAHKHHCKYVANKKVMTNTRHDDATCLVCKKESMVGKVNMSKPSNPVLPCYMSAVNDNFMNVPKTIGPDGAPLCQVMPAKPLAEMTGIYHTKLDKTFAIMMRILVKLKMTNHIIWTTCQSSAEKLYRILGGSRVAEWWALLNTKPGSTFHNAPPFIENDVAYELVHALRDIDNLFLKMPDLVLHIPWITFKILFAFSFDCRHMDGALITDCLGGSSNGLSDEIVKIRMTHAKFNKLWNNLLDKLNEGLVPLTTLVETLCEGNTVRQCYECRVKVVVQNVSVSYSSYAHFPGFPVFVLGAGLSFSLCGMPGCFESLRGESFNTARGQLIKFYQKLRWEYVGEVCDYCGGINNEVRSHRCAGCKTKIYCGVECLKKDKVHLMLCQEGEERKKKHSSGSRREKGRRDLENKLSCLGL